MKKCFFGAVCLVLFMAGCKKQTPIEPQEETHCNSVTSMGYDSTTTALLTQYVNSRTSIVKLESGVMSTVASATGYEYWGPVISPDKQKFICFRSTALGNTIKVNDYEHAELWMFDMDGSNGHLVTQLSTNNWHAMGMADWAPDGLHIVLAAEKAELTDNQLHWSIFMTDTLGSTPVKMNTRVGHFTHPHFANGNMNLITYSAWPDGISGQLNEFRNEIFYSTVTGSFQLSVEVQVTNDMKYDYAPVFSPDNANICFAKTTTTVDMSGRNLYVYNISSGNTAPIASGNTVDENPCWSPTNGRLYAISQGSGTCLAHCRWFDLATAQNNVYVRELNTHFYHVDIK